MTRRSPGGGTWPVSPHTGVVDISHAGWATGNALTAIDLCAATIAHLFCPRQDGKERSLRDFDLARFGRERLDVERRRDSLTIEFRSWVDETLRDPGYKLLLTARNTFTHSFLQRHLFAGTDPAPRS